MAIRFLVPKSCQTPKLDMRRFVFATIAESGRCLSSASKFGRFGFRGFDPGGTNQHRREQNWECPLSNHSDCWDKRLDKRSLRPNVTTESLWLNSRYKRMWVRCQLTQIHPDEGHVQQFSSLRRFEPGDELQSLCEEGRLDKALDVLDCMDQQGMVLSANMCTSLLRLCSKRKALGHAKRVHAHIAKNRLEHTRLLSEDIVNTLVKCGGLEEAVQVFYRLPHRSAFSWTAIISGYVKAGEGGEALRLYRCMREEGLQPNKYTIVSLLKACGSISDLQEGKWVHAEAVTYRCENDLFVSTSLIDMYSKCGSIQDARDVFERLSARDVVSWNAMLAAYVQMGKPETGFQLYMQMRDESASPDSWTCVSMLQASAMLAEKEEFVVIHGQMTKVNSLAKGKAVHADAFMRGYDSDVFVGNSLISMYAKSGSVVEAQHVFDGLSERDVVSWTAMLAMHAQQGQAEKALQLYTQMVDEGVTPDARMFVGLLQACVTLAEEEVGISVDGLSIKARSLWMGKTIHRDVQKKGLALDGVVGCTLLNMYGKCGSIRDAENVFSGLSESDVVPWNAMLVAYLEQGQAAKTLHMYEEMLDKGITPHDRTFVSVLQACGLLAEEEEGVMVDGRLTKAKSLERGKAIYGEAHKKGCDLDVFVGNTLISMFGKCGSIVDAQGVFEGLSKQNVVSWNAMLVAFAQQGEAEKALKLYDQMRRKGENPDETTLVCLLQACGMTGSLDLCRQVHENLVSAGNGLSLSLANTLIHAYGRCSSMADAELVFDAVPQPDVVSWTALIAGYAREGNCAATLQCYRKMLQVGVGPDGVTFLSLLSACSHAGLVGQGVEYFKSMSRDHGITPGIEHYASVVDLLGRAGKFRSIKKLLRTMPVKPDFEMWSSLLGACRIHGNIVLGKQAFDSAVRLHPENTGSYVLMSSIYLGAGMRDHAKVVDEMRQKVGAHKKPEPGQSWLEHDQNIHAFAVGGCKH